MLMIGSTSLVPSGMSSAAEYVPLRKVLIVLLCDCIFSKSHVATLFCDTLYYNIL